LPYGDYTYREYEAPEGYVIDDSEYPFEIRENGKIIKAEMTNELITSDLEITKKDVADGKLLPNAKFEIANEEGKVIREGETDENGIAYFEELEYGKYTYSEFEAPEGYVIDETPFPFEVNEDDEMIRAETKSEKNTSDIEITKKEVKEGEIIPNAGFEIADEVGNIVRKGETDENGIAYFEELEYGKYTYREFDAPEGYVIDETPFPFEVKEDGE